MMRKLYPVDRVQCIGVNLMNIVSFCYCYQLVTNWNDIDNTVVCPIFSRVTEFLVQTKHPAIEYIGISKIVAA